MGTIQARLMVDEATEASYPGYRQAKVPDFPSHSDCKECPKHQMAVSVGVPTIYENSCVPGPDVPAVVFIGINPGLEEDARGEPFVGASGFELRGGVPKFLYFNDNAIVVRHEDQTSDDSCPGAYIDGIGLRTRASIYLTNLMRCGPSPKSGDADRMTCFTLHTVPDLTSICLVHSDAPVCLVALGADPARLLFRHFLGETGIKQSHAVSRQAEPVFHQGRKMYLFSTLHPAAVVRTRALCLQVQDHLAQLSRFLDGNLPTPSIVLRIDPRDPISE